MVTGSDSLGTLPLVFASFWGRRWQEDPSGGQTASAIVNILKAMGVATVLQSSFYTRGGWIDGTNSSALSFSFVADALQDLIERGAVADLPGGDPTSYFLIFLDNTLSIRDETAIPSRAFHGYFDTMRGHCFKYGIVPDAVAANEDGIRENISRAVAAAQAIVVAMRKSEASQSEWVSIPSKPLALDERRAPRPDGIRWPSLIIENRNPRFSIKDADIERCLDELAAPLKIEDVPGASLFFRRAASLIDSRVKERNGTTRPASLVELRDFSRPLSRLTMTERFTALEATIGPNHSDIALVKKILAGVSDAAFAEMRKTYIDSGAYGFVDVVYWAYYKLVLARSLGLESCPPVSIWDIGCGGGHFSLVCQYFGHRVLGTDLEHKVYGHIAAVLGVDRRIDLIIPNKETTDFGQQFEIVCASQIEFDRHRVPGGGSRPWSLEEWKFFLNDIVARQLRFPGRIHLGLNYIVRNGEATFDLDLMRYCAAHGADVNERAGIIDWKLPARIALS